MASPFTRSSLFDELVKELGPVLFTRRPDAAARPAPTPDAQSDANEHGARPTSREIRVDVIESDAAFRVEAEIPGAAKEDVQVSIDGDVVTLEAALPPLALPSGERAIRTERQRGRLARSFRLPEPVDQATARARFEAGLLVLTLPRKVRGSGQRIEID